MEIHRTSPVGGYACRVETWLYKATPKKLNSLDTRMLADLDGFLCRSARDAAGAWANNVREVQLGDIIHMYFVERGKTNPIYAYEVIAPEAHPHPARFGRRIDETALFAVVDETFIKKRDKEGGYEHDPLEHAFTGWLLRRREPAMPFQPRWFRAQACLVRYTR
jgi:hypothetical protein